MQSLALVLALLATGSVLPVPGEGQEAFEGYQQVRRVDVLVALERLDGWLRVDRLLPQEFAIEDFEVALDGAAVDVHFVNESAAEAAAEPWRVLIYFDLTLSGPALVASTAATLAGQAEDLVRRGPVEVVVADPAPRRLLAPTADAALLGETLAGLSLAPRGRDALTRVRAEAFREHAESPGKAAVVPLWLHEVELVQRQQDHLLSWLADRPGEAARRVMFLVSGGFDVRPRAFYETLSASIGERRVADTEVAQTLLARSLAAFGWLVFSLQEPEGDPLPRRWGLRRSLLVRLDGNWDPERAEAEWALAQSLIRQQKWKRAQETLEDAIYHFYDQPKLRSRQAEAMMQLGFVLEQLGRPMEAAKVYRKAVERDPSRAPEAGPALAGLLDPLAPLATLAEATSGGFVRSGAELEALLADLGRRVRLGFQIEGMEDGDFARLEVSYRRSGFHALAPGWVSAETPAAVGAARSRQLLEGDIATEADSDRVLLAADTTGRCQFVEGETVAKLSIHLKPQLPAAWEGLPLRYRLSVSTPAPGGARTVHERVAAGIWSAGSLWSHEQIVEFDPRDPFIAFVVEEMNTGRWSGSLVECEPVV